MQHLGASLFCFTVTLTNKPVTWLPPATGHGKIEGIGVCLAKCQKSLTHKFAVSSLSSMQDVIAEFKNSGTELASEIEQVLKVCGNCQLIFHNLRSSRSISCNTKKFWEPSRQTCVKITHAI